MPQDVQWTVRDLLLVRRGLAFVETTGGPNPDDDVRAVDLELAALGYVMSERLRTRLKTCSAAELVAFRALTLTALKTTVGAHVAHEPLFRNFPEGIPDDTEELWWRKVLIHFLQSDDQPCLFCCRSGTTHVLSPCGHVVCDQCFDGSSYSACPSCEHHVDRSSPFFLPGPERRVPVETVQFKLIDLGGSMVDEARALFESLAARTQALSPADREALSIVVRAHADEVLDWVPAAIPVRENIAVIFGTLCKVCDASAVLPTARRFMTTATDVLRFIAVLSDTDGSLQRETRFQRVERVEMSSRFWGAIARMLGVPPPGPTKHFVDVPIRQARFKVARMSRSLRRAILEMLDGMNPERLVEDMLRHRSYWVWVGEFLHPHEFAKRFPNVALAFHVVRKKAPDGTRAPRVATWARRLEDSVNAGDALAMLAVLDERPGEFARRLDHVLRLAGDDHSTVDRIVAAFNDRVGSLATPVLLTLLAHLPRRTTPAAVRIYWPKGSIAKGVSSADTRSALTLRTIEPVVSAINAELIRRFAAMPGFGEGLVDEELSRIVVPFNERTASASAVTLPRGSCVRTPEGKVVRMFLHWCQPQDGGTWTDLDLSVAIYDEDWTYLGVCSYYELRLMSDGRTVIATSAGDLRDAPWPEGATEFVDLHRAEALAAGGRYAVMVVNNYSGMHFSQLERAFAGIMLRDDTGGTQFDPRTVELKFALNGENGVFLPLVLDLRTSELHWLDVQSKGGFAFNNVETSQQAITTICPQMLSYFGSAVRPTVFQLALLHAAARCGKVTLRGARMRRFTRRGDEDAVAFHDRLLSGASDIEAADLDVEGTSPIFAALFHGDVDVPEGSVVYALFRERTLPTISASDLLS